MDIEQLKLILETVGSAGEGTYILGMLYILKGYFFGLVWLGIIWLLARSIIMLVCLESFGHQVGVAYGNGSRWGYPKLNEKEQIAILTAIRKLEVN